MAKRQRDDLPPRARAALDDVLKQLSTDPYHGAKKGRDGVWWRSFGAEGQVMYLVADRIVTITVLRVAHL